MASPFEKAKARLVELGYRVGKTEYWNHFAKCRVDLFGSIDAICMKRGSRLLAIQVTNYANVSNRMKKAQQVACDWVSTGNRFEVWGFTPGSRKPPRVMGMLPNGDWAPRYYD